jgi:hypothetical protein
LPAIGQRERRASTLVRLIVIDVLDQGAVLHLVIAEDVRGLGLVLEVLAAIALFEESDPAELCCAVGRICSTPTLNSQRLTPHS